MITATTFALEIDRDVNVVKKTMKTRREEQLTNTLLQGFLSRYPRGYD